MNQEYVKNRIIYKYQNKSNRLEFFITDDFGSSISIGTKPPFMYSSWYKETLIESGNQFPLYIEK